MVNNNIPTFRYGDNFLDRSEGFRFGLERRLRRESKRGDSTTCVFVTETSDLERAQRFLAGQLHGVGLAIYIDLLLLRVKVGNSARRVGMDENAVGMRVNALEMREIQFIEDVVNVVAGG